MGWITTFPYWGVLASVDGNRQFRLPSHPLSLTMQPILTAREVVEGVPRSHLAAVCKSQDWRAAKWRLKDFPPLPHAGLWARVWLL
jgi:hypothetical protein